MKIEEKLKDKTHEILNTSGKKRRLLCAVMLLLYFSGLPVVSGSRIFGTLFNVMEFVTVALMFPQIKEEAAKVIKKPKTMLYIFLGIVMLAVFDVILWDNILLPTIKNMTGIYPENGNNNRLLPMIRQNPVVMLPMVCVFGPLLEEILYRYTAFGIIQEKNRPVAHIVTALLFGIQHIAVAGIWGGDTAQLMNIGGYMVFSLVMTFLFSKTKTLCIPVLLHIMFNSFGLAFMLGSNA